MADVVFYLIQSAEQSIESLACRLCRRVAIGAKTPVFVCFDDAAALHSFDQLLWSFEPDSFVPHAIDDAHAPVCLGLQPPDDFKGCCLNLASRAVDTERFERVLEIIGADDAAKAQGRQRFRDYRQAGLVPQTHQV